MRKDSNDDGGLKRARLLLWSGTLLMAISFCFNVPWLIIQTIFLFLTFPPIYLDILGIPASLLITSFLLIPMGAGLFMAGTGKIRLNRIYSLRVLKQVPLEFLVLGYSYVLAKKGEIFLLVHGACIYVVKVQALKVTPSRTLKLPQWYGLIRHRKIDRVRLFNINRIITLPINEVQFGRGLAVGLGTSYGLTYPLKTPDTLLKIIEQVQSKIE